MKISRRDVRAKAMQVLYAYEISQEPIELLFESIVAEEFDAKKEYREFAQSLVYKTLKNVSEADLIIKNHAKNWDFDRIATIDKILLRMGVIELLYYPEIPAKVSISEYVEIGSRYSTDHSASFLNGMLDAIATHLKDDGRMKKVGRGLV